MDTKRITSLCRLPGALASALLLSSSGCGPVGFGCTDILIYSLTVTVTDGSGTPVCDATVTAREGSFTAVLEKQSLSSCTYVGPPERAGTYEVIVSRPGRAPATRTVTVSGDRCHVNGEALTVQVP
jgi:hypothetical protein